MPEETNRHRGDAAAEAGPVPERGRRIGYRLRIGNAPGRKDHRNTGVLKPEGLANVVAPGLSPSRTWDNGQRLLYKRQHFQGIDLRFAIPRVYADCK
jgi:hypothetical protein